MLDLIKDVLALVSLSISVLIMLCLLKKCDGNEKNG